MPNISSFCVSLKIEVGEKETSDVARGSLTATTSSALTTAAQRAAMVRSLNKSRLITPPDFATMPQLSFQQMH